MFTCVKLGLILQFFDLNRRLAQSGKRILSQIQRPSQFGFGLGPPGPSFLRNNWRAESNDSRRFRTTEGNQRFQRVEQHETSDALVARRRVFVPTRQRKFELRKPPIRASALQSWGRKIPHLDFQFCGEHLLSGGVFQGGRLAGRFPNSSHQRNYVPKRHFETKHTVNLLRL